MSKYLVLVEKDINSSFGNFGTYRDFLGSWIETLQGFKICTDQVYHNMIHQ